MKEGHDLYPELQRTYLKNSTDATKGVRVEHKVEEMDNGIPELNEQVTAKVDEDNYVIAS